MRSSQPIGVTQLSSQASSEWADTCDCAQQKLERSAEIVHESREDEQRSARNLCARALVPAVDAASRAQVRTYAPCASLRGPLRIRVQNVVWAVRAEATGR
eukprot:238802-Pleurochrysis_carterae.AAC.3